jgi:hypothetical protein
MTSPPPAPAKAAADPEATRMLLNMASLALGYVISDAWPQFSAWLNAEGEAPPLPDGKMRKLFTLCYEKLDSAAGRVTSAGGGGDPA